jgi:uroporphyrinogen decarboxylase
MNSRQRVEYAINLKEPDRVPIDVGSTACNITNNLFFKVKKILEISSKDTFFRPDESAAYYNDDVLEKLGTDFRHIFLMPPDDKSMNVSKEGILTNEWGIKKRNIGGLIENISNPLKDAQIYDLDHYNWPNADKGNRARGLKERAKNIFKVTDYAIAARSVSHGFFEVSWELRGMEKFLEDMIINKRFANRLLDKVLDIQIKLYEKLLHETEKYVQIVETADDYGTQNGLMMSPKMFKEFIKPRRKELNSVIKSLAPRVKIFHHSCGGILKIIEQLIDTGVEILNPVQPLASGMDSFNLKKQYGNVLCFHGGIDEQKALPGCKENLEKEIQLRIDAFAPGGGYIAAPTSNFQEDTPIENIFLFLSKVKKYGKY